MKLFYKIDNNGELITGGGIDIPSGYTEYTEDNLPDAIGSLRDKQKKSDSIRLAKVNGEYYNNTEYKIPFTSNDALAVLQVKSAFEIGVTSTNIEFTNGTVMPIDHTEFQEFAVWFVNKRNDFFI